MSDVVIRGMEMPKSCDECRLFNESWCMALGVENWRKSYNKPPEGGRLPDCPLVPLPEGRGKLGDLDEIVKRLNEMEADFDKKGFHQGACWVHVIAELLRKAPTIVPPEPPKEKTNETPSKPKRGSQRKSGKANKSQKPFADYRWGDCQGEEGGPRQGCCEMGEA